MENIHKDNILIIDFGSQYTQLIARRVREIGVFSELASPEISAEEFKKINPKGIILSGGPESVTSNNLDVPDWLINSGLPILGICYGMQVIAQKFGGKVASTNKKEFGYASLNLKENHLLLAKLDNTTEKKLDVWMSHGDQVIELPADFDVIASTDSAPIAVIAHQTKPVFGVQFHPEVTHTSSGMEILKRFVVDICQCQLLWQVTDIIDDAINSIKQMVNDDIVLLGLSGGVDSSVTAALLNQAIGKQLICIFVDTGLLRLNEGDQVMQIFAETMDLNVVRVNAKERFFEGLKGVEDPEQKRKIIGRLFVEIFEEQAAKFEEAKFLAQGTIYPDVIESAGNSAKAHVIKTHHNVGGLPEEMNLALIEPLRELFKDEVRKLGLQLGLPKKLIFRHPFPGPGLGVRILGEVKSEYAEILAQADDIFMNELRQAGWYEKTSQAFAVFLPVKSVGVVGDARCYDYVIALRAVETVDFMTANKSALPHDLLHHISNRIVNEVNGVSRVVYDISSKPPATIEWE